jgi:molybdate transport system substrate-binding protein
MDEVQQRFDSRVLLSNNPLIMITAPGNPLQLKGLGDLARPGLRVGLAHPEHSALGRLTRQQMEQENLAADFAASGNLKQDAPQGDFLVNALLTGALDATVVYTSNAALAGAKIDRVSLAPKAFAEQPFAMARQSDQRYLLQRLFDAVTSSGSQDRFTELGFDWRFGEDSR